jgi:hypothetical protein
MIPGQCGTSIIERLNARSTWQRRRLDSASYRLGESTNCSRSRAAQVGNDGKWGKERGVGVRIRRSERLEVRRETADLSRRRLDPVGTACLLLRVETDLAEID